VLGRIPAGLLGGEVPLDADAARAGFTELAEGLELSLEWAAAGVLEIACWNQTHGIRQVTIERGRDPRAYCLVAFGGSGPLIAARIADLLEMEEAIVEPIFEHWPVNGIRPGDVFFSNDPYRSAGGIGHVPDLCTTLPIFHEDRLIAFVQVFGHHDDVCG